MRGETDFTKLLINIKESENGSSKKLFPLVYDELKQIAYSKLQRERKDITFTKTSLVHEVYLKMVDQSTIKANDKNHFLAITARCMRQILIDHARKKKAQKRGGDREDVTYIDELLKAHYEADQLIDLDAKLDELAQLDERMADVVTLRFFGRMKVSAIADALDVSERTVKRDWAKARGWLYKELKGN